jgi:triacylglycerol lipase
MKTRTRDPATDGTVPAMLLGAVALELAIYLALARMAFHLTWPASAACAASGMMLTRAVIVLVTWALASAHAAGRTELPATRRLGMWIAEYLAFLAHFVVLMPFERFWMPPDRLRRCQRPILLVHGYSCSRGLWWWMRRRLESAGYVVATVNLAPPYVGIDALVPQLARRIDAVREETGADRVTVVAHSMGGLVSRAYLAKHGSAYVERLVTLGTPHQGSELARIGFGRNAREMEPDSRWLQALGKAELAVPATSVRNIHDNYVTPNPRQRLPGAEDVPIDGVGHLALMFSPRALAIVERSIGAPG